MTKLLQLELDRSANTPLAEQVDGISTVIDSGVLRSRRPPACHREDYL
jgi:hypothetical protein